MANIATDVKWGSSPTNYFNFSYTKQRSGTTQQYKITVECEPCSGASYFGYPIYLEISVNGAVAATKTLKKSSPSQWTKSLTYTTEWVSVANKTTGTTPLKIRIYSGSGSSRNTSYSYNLAIDPAGSLIAAADANIESTSSVIFTRYNSSFTHTLAYKAAGQSSYTTIFTKQNITNYGWTVPASLYALIPNDTTIEVTLQCQTYSGSTLVGTDTCTMTATAAKSKCSPNISVTAEDVNENTIALTGDKKRVIRYHSDIKVTATPTAKNSARIEKTTLKFGANTYTGTTNTFTDAESVDISATTTDSREYSTAADAAGLTLIPYIKLTNNATVKRTSPTSDTVIVSTKGNYYNGSFGAVNNTLRLQVRYKPKSRAEFETTDTWTEMTVTISGNTYTAEATLTGLDYKQAYDIRVRAQDQIYKYEGPLANAVYHNLPLSKGVPVCDWGENDFNFNVAITRTSDEGIIKLCYEPGDTLTQKENIVYAGIITGSTKNLYFFIPLEKPVAAASATIEGEVIGRGVGGYINGTSGSDSQINLAGGDNYTVETWLRGNGIQMVIRFAAAITNATNNTPVSVVPYGDLTIQFL